MLIDNRRHGTRAEWLPEKIDRALPGEEQTIASNGSHFFSTGPLAVCLADVKSL